MIKDSLRYQHHLIRCHSYVLVKNGKIPSKPCEVCGTTKKVQLHHDDFDPGAEYRIRFLCREHHRELHRALRATTKPAVLSRVDKRKLRATDDNLSPLLAWRLRSGLSQGDLAAALGVCASVLSRIEHGQAGFNDKVINFLNQQLGEAEANEMILAQERFVGDTMRRIRSVLRDQEVAA